jgi:hypothetical protein
VTPLAEVPAEVTAQRVRCVRIGAARQWVGRVGQCVVHVTEDVSAWTVAERDASGDLSVGYGATLEAADADCDRRWLEEQARRAASAANRQQRAA